MDLLLPKNVADIGDAGDEAEVTLDKFIRSFPKPYSELTALPFPLPLQVLVASSLLSCFIKDKMADYVGGFAGQICGLIREIKPAAQLLHEMVAETVDILTRKMPQHVLMQ